MIVNDLIELLEEMPLYSEVAVSINEEFRPIHLVRESDPKGLIILEVE